MRLKNKTAIVTGAAGNIGLAVAIAFQREGASLVLVDHEKAALDRAQLSLLPDRVVGIVSNVTDANDTTLMVRTAEETFGGVDIFFGNAGIEGISSSVTEYPPDIFDRVMAVNVKGIFLGLTKVLPRMRDGGSVVLTSSIMGLKGTPLNIAYTASKHAVVGLMRSAAIEAGKRGIRVNSIHPGYVDSAMLRRLMDQHEDPRATEKRFISQAKLGRLVLPEEVASAVLFLASDESRAITNQQIVVDAGVLD
jgi:NAD(P)-dependent dehydrogenase (short-subunit alcohol dehydrogenase family)